MSIDAFLRTATAELGAAGIGTARLDVLVLLSDVLDHSKAWLLAHDNEQLSSDQEAALREKIARRAAREPLSYIRGTQEFFGHSFDVTPDVLIPRPETEMLVELVLNLPLKTHSTIVDVGTGSGAIAISIKVARQDLDVYATDISPAAIAVAKRNAQRFHADVTFAQSDLLANTPIGHPSAIIANLPYVDTSWKRSPETDYEPTLALFAADSGLTLIKKLIGQAASMLPNGGYLLLEADPRQLDAIVTVAQAAGFRSQFARDYSLVFMR